MNDPLPIEIEAQLHQWGADIALARKRRKLRQTDVAARAGLARQTVARVEAGHEGTPVSAYLRVMWALRLPTPRLADPELDREGRTAAQRLPELSDDF
jgi:transcriptional regulator with XRE-family HTH domain